MRARALMYHDLSDAASGFTSPWANLYKISETEFKAHLDAIAGAGLSDRIASVETAGNAGWSGIPVFLTFDDGGVSAVRIAAILASRGWCGHFFITTGRIGEAGFVGESEIREMRALGHVVGSHSVTHPTRMRSLTREQLAREWKESVERLRQILGADVRTASVPGGFYSRAVGETASEVGIRNLFNSEPVERVAQAGECRIMGRYYIQNRTSSREAAAFAAGDWWVCGKQRWNWNGRKVLKSALGPAYVAAGRVFRG